MAKDTATENKLFAMARYGAGGVRTGERVSRWNSAVVFGPPKICGSEVNTV